MRVNTSVPFKSEILLRDFYCSFEKEIISQAKINRFIDINYLEFYFKSPAEAIFWDIVKFSDCKMIFYPQYPVGIYYIDFANPYHKIGIEIDGYKYHPKVNTKRETYLLNNKWVICHLPATECFAYEENEECREVNLVSILIDKLNEIVDGINYTSNLKKYKPKLARR